jgi:hypothetical protein
VSELESSAAESWGETLSTECPIMSPPLTDPSRLEDLEQGSGNGVALSLSGGGYRAMVFHVGALWRINEAGLLPKLMLIGQVSALVSNKISKGKWKGMANPNPNLLHFERGDVT